MTAKIYIYKNRGPYVQVCAKGHDITLRGRDSKGACFQCKEDWHEVHYQKRLRVKKPLCKRGHNISIVGRDSANNCKACKKLWETENKAKRILVDLKKRATRHLRVPNFGQGGIHKFCAATPIGMEVDHIIPLLGKLVSGLHVSWNLQYLTREQNSQKKNKIDLLWASEWYGKILEEAGLK